MVIFEGENADQIWRSAMENILSSNACSQSSRLGYMKEILHVNIHIRNPKERWICSRQPSLNPAFAIAETIWTLAGLNESALINHWNPTLPKYAGDVPNYHGAYGHRIRRHFKIDQLERAYEVLKNDKDSRQVILQIWDPAIDLPDSRGVPVSPDIPCNICSILKIRNKKLEWFQVMRSNDIYRGMPYDIVQFTTLQEILAGWLGVEIGEYFLLSDSLHLYEKDRSEIIIDKSEKNITNSDSLALSRVEFEEVLQKFLAIMKMMLNVKLTEKTILDTVDDSALPQPYKNMLVVVISDAVRRRGWHNCVTKLMHCCDNPILVKMWNRWYGRVCNE